MAKPGRPKRQEPHKVARYNGHPRHQVTSPRRPASRERWSRLLLFRETFETVRSSSLDHSILSYLIVALRSLAHCASPLISKQTTWVGLAFTVTLVPGSISFVEPWLLWIFLPDGRRT